MKRCVDDRLLPLLCAVLLSACSTPPLRSDAPPRAAAPQAATPASPAAGSTMAAAQTRFEAALKLMQDGQREAAVAALQALCRDYPQFSGPYTDLGILYSKMQRRDAAIASFAQALQRNPDNVVALNYLGGLYREAGDYTRAEQAYQQAQRVRRDYAPSYLNLAILYELSLHRPQQALSQYRLYQQYAGAQAQPMVTVWIKEIELAGAAPSNRVVAGAGP